MLKINNLSVHSYSKILVYGLIFAVFMFIGIQLFVLTSVGVQGDRVAAIRARKQEVMIENEILEAKILELQSRAHVVGEIDNIQVETAEVEYIDVNSTEVFALLSQ